MVPFRSDIAMVGDDMDEELDEDQQTTPQNNPDQFLWADDPRDDDDDSSIMDARDPDDRAEDDADADDEGSDTEDVRPLAPRQTPPARVRPTNATRGLGDAIRHMVQATTRTFSDVTTRAISPRMRQRGIALAIIVTADGRVKVCQ